MSYITGLTDTQLRASPPSVSISNASIAVTGTFFQATQPVSGTITVGNASLAVTGAFYQATQPVSGTVSISGTVPVSGTFWQATQPVSLASTTITGSVAVTGSFYQATQPVSAASLPLPAGASTETTLAALNTKTISAANVTASGTLTASDAVVGAPVGDGTIVSGASTAGSVVAIAVPDRMSGWLLMIKGYVSGTIYTEASSNSTNGTDGDWVEVKGRRTGTAPGTESVVYAMVANGYYRGNSTGFRYLRARLIGGTGPTIRWDLSTATGAVFLNSGLPGGSSSIGTVVLGAGSAAVGTVAVSGTVPVSGTFYQATQPVSIATMPSTPVTGTFWQATQPVSLTSTTITGSVAVTGTFWQATQPVSGTVTTTPPTLTKATQGATGYSVQDLKDSGRAIVNAATAIAGVTAVTTEALVALNVSRDAATTASVTTIAVTSGKRYRVTQVIIGMISTAAAVLSGRFSLRMNPAGAVTATSPIIATTPISSGAALAQAGGQAIFDVPDGIEFSGTMQIGISQVCSATTGTIWVSVLGYEY